MNHKHRIVLFFKLIFLAIAVITFSSLPAIVESNAAASKPIMLNSSCASKETFKKANLLPITQKIWSTEKIWSADPLIDKALDQAIAIELNNDSQLEYLILLFCSPTGNCDWAIVAGKPFQVVGVINACVLVIEPTEKGWPTIVSYSHMSAYDGYLTTYTYSGSKFYEKSSVHIEGQAVELYEECKDSESCCP